LEKELLIRLKGDNMREDKREEFLEEFMKQKHSHDNDCQEEECCKDVV
tara:strand:- start:442 stop:585 length:144 start_codon:yes stop_codon:yes gene_type:complete